MGLKEIIKKKVDEFLHPSFESLMHEFAIVEDASAVTEERIEHFKVIIEQQWAEEAREKALEEKKRMKEEARAAKKAAKAAKAGKKSDGE